MAGHPPLTSLRSFAPPCAEAKGKAPFALSGISPTSGGNRQALDVCSRVGEAVDSGFRRNDGVRGMTVVRGMAAVLHFGGV